MSCGAGAGCISVERGRQSSPCCWTIQPGCRQILTSQGQVVRYANLPCWAKMTLEAGGLRPLKPECHVGSCVVCLAGLDSIAARDMRKACMLNLASCHLNTGQHTHCISECSAVLRDSAHDRKALYRRGQAYLALEDFPQAVRDLREALERYRLELFAWAPCISCRRSHV